MFFPFDCIDLSYIIIAFFWHLLRLGSFWYWRSIKCYTFLEAMIHLGLIFIILHYIIHIYIYTYTVYNIYVYIYMYISPSYVLHHIFHVTCRCFLGPRFGRAMSCCVASPQELQAKFHQWGGVSDCIQVMIISIHLVLKLRLIGLVYVEKKQESPIFCHQSIDVAM